MTSGEIVIHTDGGSRGNPGLSACGFVAEKDGREVYSGNKFLGVATNNFAEYSGVLLALEWLKNQNNILENQSVIFYLDSELIVRQLNGLYKVKDGNLKKLHTEILKEISVIGIDVSFKNIPREQNKIADLLVNESLDLNS